MKKSVLSIVAIAFAAVSVFTSCDKSNDNYAGHPAPTLQTGTSSSASSTLSDTNSSMTTYSANYFIEDALAQLGTFTVTVTDGTKTSSYDLVAQGQRGTYDNGNLSKSDIRNGYTFKVSQPNDKPLKFTVTFTPNDKAKSLTDETEINGCYAFYYTSNNGGKATTKGRGNELRQVEGSLVTETLNNVATAMSKQF